MTTLKELQKRETGLECDLIAVRKQIRLLKGKTRVKCNYPSLGCQKTFSINTLIYYRGFWLRTGDPFPIEKSGFWICPGCKRTNAVEHQKMRDCKYSFLKIEDDYHYPLSS